MIDAVLATLPENLAAIRQRRPLIHNITNLVVGNVTANALLALGASPAMVENTEEAAELAAIADALVINLGTVSTSIAAAMHLATRAADDAGRPWIMDPVAAGALQYRTSLARDLIKNRPAVIRGNASEIAALAGQVGGGKGVDSLLRAEQAVEAARILARGTAAVIVVSGAVDYVTDGSEVVAIANGHPLMTRVTGMGCTATALIGAFLAVSERPLIAAAQAMVTMGVAGEMAMTRATGPGSLQVAFLDGLHELSGAEICAQARVA
ncbi:MAG TPA: hydroxyethylthiazole kinase [Terriglobia bacterium]|nr:hydroxyethylthiazole kinase [Terriglobia bacterium]